MQMTDKKFSEPASAKSTVKLCAARAVVNSLIYSLDKRLICPTSHWQKERDRPARLRGKLLTCRDLSTKLATLFRGSTIRPRRPIHTTPSASRRSKAELSVSLFIIVAQGSAAASSRRKTAFRLTPHPEDDSAEKS
jgi:hypothetical protein